MGIKIYGASDDLIEIEGDITEEFNVYLQGDQSKVLAFSDGTVVRVAYDKDGIWRITRLFGGTCGFDKIEGDVQADTNDIVNLIGRVEWCVMGDSVVRP